MKNFSAAFLCALVALSSTRTLARQEDSSKQRFNAAYAAATKSADVDAKVKQKIKLLYFIGKDGKKNWAIAIPADVTWDLEIRYVGDEASKKNKDVYLVYFNSVGISDPKATGQTEVHAGPAPYSDTGEVQIRAIMPGPPKSCTTGVISLALKDATLGKDIHFDP